MHPTGRLTLAIENSNPTAGGGDAPSASVAIGTATAGGAPHVLGVEPLRSVGRHGDDLMPAIDRLCQRVGARPTDLARIAVSVGPGGYTALRVAIATAKMIAEVSGGRCIAVPTAMAIVHRLPAAARARGIAVALASKSTPGAESAWIAVFPDGDPAVDPARSGRIMAAADIAGLGVGALAADRFFPAPMRAAAHAAGIDVIEPIFDAAAVFETSALGQLPELDPLDLLPLYPREPDAVSLWRARHPASQ